MEENKVENLFLVVVTVDVIVNVVIKILTYKNKKYKKTSYYQITKNPYSSIKYDKGKYGEYLTYKHLKHFENNGGKFLFNIYLPKSNNKMTEIDILLICSKGLFVFENKNYSGWIFGNEAQKYWTQTFSNGRKYSFYNPIMQNAIHIKYLKPLIGKNVPLYSIIIFSDACTLIDIAVKNNNIIVTNLCKVTSFIAQICNQVQGELLTQTEVSNIYHKLYPYTQANYDARSRHAEDVQNIKAIFE